MLGLNGAHIWERGGAIALALLAFTLGLHELSAAAVSWDEGFSTHLAYSGFAQATLRTAHDNHPPLFYWLLAAWMGLAGVHEVTLRFPAVVAYVLVVVLLFRWGRDAGGPWAALAAGLVMGLHRLALEWGQSIRMYAPGLLFSTLALYAFWRSTVAEASGQRWRWSLVAAVAMTAGLLTHYLAAIAWAAQVLWAASMWLLGKRRDAVLLKPWGLALGTPLCIAGAWLFWALPQRTLYHVGGYALFPLDFLLRVYGTVLALGISVYIERYTWATALFVGVAALSLLGLRQRERGHDEAIVLQLLVLALGGCALVLLSLPEPCKGCPKLYVRYILFMVPAFAMLVGLGLAQVRRWPALALGLLGVLVGLQAMALADYYRGRPGESAYAPLAARIAREAAQGEGVVLYPDPDWPYYAFYAIRYGAPAYWHAIPTEGQLTGERVDRTLSEAVGRHPALWVVALPDRRDVDPQGLVEAWLRSHGTLETKGTSGDLLLLRFVPYD